MFFRNSNNPSVFLDPGEQFSREMLAYYPDDWDTRCDLIDTLMLRGDLDQAVQLIEEAPAMPEEDSYLYKMVEVYMKTSPYTAITLLNGLLARNAEDPKANLAIADVYLSMGNAAKARDHYRRALDRQPEFRDRLMERRMGVNPKAPVMKYRDRKKANSGRGRRQVNLETVDRSALGPAPRSFRNGSPPSQRRQPSEPVRSERLEERRQRRRERKKEEKKGVVGLVLLAVFSLISLLGVVIWLFQRG
jgi:tetratricopeptide (TPR) repeat protein